MYRVGRKIQQVENTEFYEVVINKFVFLIYPKFQCFAISK